MDNKKGQKSKQGSHIKETITRLVASPVSTGPTCFADNGLIRNNAEIDFLLPPRQCYSSTQWSPGNAPCTCISWVSICSSTSRYIFQKQLLLKSVKQNRDMIFTLLDSTLAAESCGANQFLDMLLITIWFKAGYAYCHNYFVSS